MSGFKSMLRSKVNFEIEMTSVVIRMFLVSNTVPIATCAQGSFNKKAMD